MNEELFQGEICPECGSDDTTTDENSDSLCDECGHCWNENEEKD